MTAFSGCVGACVVSLGIRCDCWSTRFTSLHSQLKLKSTLQQLSILQFLLMEIIQENAFMLSNFEVYELLTDIQEGRNGQKKPNKFLSHLATISYEAQEYLDKTPCHEQNAEQIEAFKKALAPFKFTKAEILQLINHRPQTAVEIQLFIEESEERLGEDDVEKVIEIIRTCFPVPESDVAEEEMQEEEHEDEDNQS